MTQRAIYIYHLFLSIGLLGSVVQGQNSVKSYFELSELGDVPGVIQVSTDYLTIIEFEDYKVEDARSARSDLFIIEQSDNIITIRANEEVVNTDVYARVNGQTVLFKLESDKGTASPRRYIVRNTQPAQRGIQSFMGISGSSRPPIAGNTPLFPQGLLFEADVFKPRQNEVIVQYRLMNESEHPIINDPYRLRIYYGDTSVNYKLERSPAPGRPNYLAPDEAEFGQLVIPAAPANLDAIELEWDLVEVGPGTKHKLIRNFGELAQSGLDTSAAPLPVISTGDEEQSETQNSESQADEVAGPQAAPEPVAEPSTKPTSAEPKQVETRQAEPEQSDISQQGQSGLSEATSNEANSESSRDAAILEEPTPKLAPAESANIQDSDAQGDAAQGGAAATLLDDQFNQDDGTWHFSAVQGAEGQGQVVEGEYCITVDKVGTAAWHLGLRTSRFTLVEGQPYTLSWSARAERPVIMVTNLLRNVDPRTVHARWETPIASKKATYQETFTPDVTDDKVKLIFLLGAKDNAGDLPTRICLDDVKLTAAGADLD